MNYSLQIAYEKWRQHQPPNMAFTACCFKDHTGKPDEEVCAREKSWREYVRIRDENPQFPFTEREWIYQHRKYQ